MYIKLNIRKPHQNRIKVQDMPENLPIYLYLDEDDL